MSIRSSTVLNRSAAVMSRSGSVDEWRRHRRSIARHRIDAGFLFFSHLAQMGMNHGDSRPES